MRDITKITVWDFDGTLMKTPTPDFGKMIYKQKTGNVWPYTGWWGHKESLDPKIFKIEINKSVVDDYNKEKTNLNTLLVLLTGRLQRLSKEVEELLSKNNLSFDEYHYNTGGRTDKQKIKVLDSLVAKYPNLDLLEMWDDRIEHIPTFETWGKENVLAKKIKDFKINVILSDHF